MNKEKISLMPVVLVLFYFYIYFVTELLSFFHQISVLNIFILDLLAVICFIIFFQKQILKIISFKLNRVYLIIFVFLVLTFIQGFVSAPSTTDAMVYHIPRTMHWLQEHTLFQKVILTKHDFMAPFADYILLHLYSIINGDRLLFLSQWIAYASSIYISGLIAKQLGGSQNTVNKVRLLITFLPIAVMQSVSTQIDMVSALFPLLCLYFSLKMKKKITFQNSILFGLSVGLGFMTKAPSIFFMIPSFGIIFWILINNRFVGFWYIFMAGTLSVIMQIRYLYQNYLLFGSFLGKHLTHVSGEELVLTNEKINLSVVISNLIKNIMMHIPVPFFSSFAESIIEKIHLVINLPVNSPISTCCGMVFKIQSIIYPQEDIVVNPLHLIIIIVSGFMILKKKNRLKSQFLLFLYGLLIISMTAFGSVIKWQIYHSRFHIPFFLIGTILGVLIIEKEKFGNVFLKIMILLSGFLGFTLIMINVSRPYISYASFYKYVKPYSPSLASVPTSFLVKPRVQHYFKARWYWYQPYEQVVKNLNTTENDIIAVKLMDDFEYPLWAIMKTNKIKGKIVSEYQIEKANVIITTSENPITYVGFQTSCLKTLIDYGYICLSKTS